MFLEAGGREGRIPLSYFPEISPFLILLLPQETQLGCIWLICYRGSPKGNIPIFQEHLNSSIIIRTMIFTIHGVFII